MWITCVMEFEEEATIVGAADTADEDACTLAAAPPEEMKKVEALFDTADILSFFSYRWGGRHGTMRSSSRFQANKKLMRLVRDEAKMMDSERVHTVHARPHARTLACTHAHLFAHTHICTHTRTHAHAYTCVGITMYAHMYIHMYIHTHWSVSYTLKSHIIVTPNKYDLNIQDNIIIYMRPARKVARKPSIFFWRERWCSSDPVHVLQVCADICGKIHLIELVDIHMYAHANVSEFKSRVSRVDTRNLQHIKFSAFWSYFWEWLIGHIAAYFRICKFMPLSKCVRVWQVKINHREEKNPIHREVIQVDNMYVYSGMLVLEVKISDFEWY